MTTNRYTEPGTTPHPPSPSASGGHSARLDAERLDCYHVALEFQALAASFVLRRGQSALRDQLNRASISIILNTAEGAGRFSRADKARFFAIARGSATECAALVDILVAQGILDAPTAFRGRNLLVRLIQMLTRLAMRR